VEIRGAGALVTGGASGLGEATARMLADAGATVTIVDLDADRGRSTAADVGGTFVRADVASEEDVRAAVAAADEAAPLRIAVNCAGIAHGERTIARDGSPHDLAAFERVLRVNLLGTFNVLRLAASAIARAEPLVDGERGVIVNTASIAAYEGQIGQAAYAASKAGVVGLTITTARDLAPSGIRVCTIAPGTFETPMVATLPDAAREALAAAVPFPSRLGAPAEYAAVVRTICETTVLNGETIRLDGALRMAPR
jgi:NAD(P)-dependent dehydrogenase (short-subunit alcohol dehydrogenase family)